MIRSSFEVHSMCWLSRRLGGPTAYARTGRDKKRLRLPRYSIIPANFREVFRQLLHDIGMIFPNVVCFRGIIREVV